MQSTAQANPGPVSDQSFRDLVDTVKDVIFQTDATGLWTYLNPAWQEVTGFPVAESLGRNFLEYVHPDDRGKNQERFRPLIEREKEYCRHVVRYLTRDGSFREIEVFAKLLLDKEGRILGTTGRLSDITEQQNTIAALRDAQSRLAALLSSSPALIYQAFAGAARRFHYVSENAGVRVGFDAATCMQPGFWSGRIHPEDRAAVEQAGSPAGDAHTWQRQYRFLHADGRYRWLMEDVEVTARDSGGRAEVLTGCIVDVTEQVEAVLARRRGEAILACVSGWAESFLKADSWQPVIDPALEQLGTASEVAHVRLFRYLPQHFSAGLRFVLTSLWRSPDVQPSTCAASELEAGLSIWEPQLLAGSPVAGNIRSLPEPARGYLERNGCQLIAVIPIIAAGSLWGALELEDSRTRDWFPAELDALKAAANIIGASVQNEQARHTLRWREALLSAMAGTSPLAFYVADDRSGTVLYFNDRFSDIWKLQADHHRMRSGDLRSQEVMAKCARQLSDPDGFLAAVDALQSVTNRAMLEDELNFADSRVVRHFTSQIRDSFDRYFGRLHLFEDVTERRRIAAELEKSRDELEQRVIERTSDLERANLALRESQRRFRAMFEEAPVGILVLNSEGAVTDANQALASMLEGTVELERLLAFSEMVEDPASARGWGPIEDVIAGVRENCVVETKLRTFRNNTVWVRISLSPLHPFDDDRRFVLGMVQNISERKRLEDQFRHSQKMDALGRLAGGVAHDFNNLLTVIRGYTELMLKRMDPEHLMYPKVGQIKRASDRAASLVQQLLAFSRKQVVEPKTIAVNAAVTDMEKMLRRLIGEDIELVTVLGPDAGYVSMDPGQLEQIIVNLTINARHAMADSGTLVIETGRQGTATGRNVVLKVTDSGTGMTEEVVSRIFEPFFTTKPVGKGTGLGLATVYGIVQQMQGRISVASEPGKGSCFTILLPMVDAEESKAGAEDPLPPSPARETVLVVEDEDLVRTMVCDALREEGYTVLQAVDGCEAMAVLEAMDTAIHLVLTDVVMPRMGGKELVQWIAERKLEIAVLYMSGYNEAEWDPDLALLRKPFTADLLVARVRKAMEAANRTPAPADEVSSR